MRNFAAAIIAEKNKQSGDPWAALFECSVPGAPSVYFTNYDIPITFNGNTYLVFPFQVGDVKESSRGELEKVTIAVANVSREMQAILEEYDMVGQTAYLRYVNVLHLDNPDPAYFLELGPYRVKETPFDEKNVNFTLGPYNILERPLPWGIFDRLRCRHAFSNTGSGRCGWSPTKGLATGADPNSCDHTLSGANGCEAHLNYNTDNKGIRFGGFPGIPTTRDLYG